MHVFIKFVGDEESNEKRLKERLSRLAGAAQSLLPLLNKSSLVAPSPHLKERSAGSMAERLTTNQEVPGSTPGWIVIFIFALMPSFN